jgi:steroid delta-isomerase-like uncharacterized protein
MAPRVAGLAFAACVLLGCVETNTAELERNKDLVRRNAEALNNRDVTEVEATMAADLVRHSQATPELEIRSLEQFKEFLQEDWATFPDSRITITHLVAEGDLVAIWGTYAGTQQGQMGPFPATGNRMELDIAGVFRIEDDKIAEIWVTWDNVAGLAQLGLMPPPPSP